MTTVKSSVELAAQAEIARRTEDVFRRSGALKEGHFQLKSGRHSERYLEKFLVLQDPAATGELVGFWRERYRVDGGSLADLVAGPTTGGIILAFEAARQLGVRGIFAEEVRAADGTPRPCMSPSRALSRVVTSWGFSPIRMKPRPSTASPWPW